MRAARPIRVITLLALIAPAVLAATADAVCGAPPPMEPLTFGDPKVIDPVRAGGEPSIQPLPDGTLIYASHAGATHLYKPNLPDPNFVTPYTGADYVWRSEDRGETWRYVGLNGSDRGPHAVGALGFSDPTTAVDAAGNVYVAGIDVVNVYVAKSSDSGKTWEANPLAAVLTDREWLAADEEDVVYMNGTMFGRGPSLWKSKDGARTWDLVPHELPGSGAASPLAIDPADGRLYYPFGITDVRGGVAVYPDAREDDYSTGFRTRVFGGLPHYGGFINPVALDEAGNVYIASNTDREVRLSYSTDRGNKFQTTVVRKSQPLPNGERTLGIWPWVAAGDDGRVALVWLERGAEGRWSVMAAHTRTAHGWVDGCGEPQEPVWEVTQATGTVHAGEVCASGLACNVWTDPRSDRRLGDYFTAAIDDEGMLVIAYPDTASDPGAAISHPGFVRQTGGLSFREKD